MTVDEQTLSKLLRLKRHEQPPPGYYDDFLREFQNRQRAELLRRPAWRIAMDRLEAFSSQFFTVARVSYATASFAVLCAAAVLTVKMVQHPGSSVVATITDARGPNQPAPVIQVVSAPRGAGMNAMLVPNIRIPEALLNASVQPMGDGQRPRYILDARPASYEPPFSF